MWRHPQKLAFLTCSTQQEIIHFRHILYAGNIFSLSEGVAQKESGARVGEFTGLLLCS